MPERTRSDANICMNSLGWCSTLQPDILLLPYWYCLMKEGVLWGSAENDRGNEIREKRAHELTLLIFSASAMYLTPASPILLCWRFSVVRVYEESVRDMVRSSGDRCMISLDWFSGHPPHMPLLDHRYGCVGDEVWSGSMTIGRNDEIRYMILLGWFSVHQR